LQDRRHDASRLLAVLVLQHLTQDSGNDLPRHTESVFEPPALDFLAASGELLPEVVYFRLRLAVHDKGDRLGKFEDRPAVQRDKFLPIELECHRHHRSLWSSGGLRRLFGVAGHASDLRVFEDRHVKIHGVFSLMIEPQEWADLFRRLSHWCLPCPVLSVSLEGSNDTRPNRRDVDPPTKQATP